MLPAILTLLHNINNRTVHPQIIPSIFSDITMDYRHIIRYYVTSEATTDHHPMNPS